MKKNTHNGFKLIEIDDFLADAAMEGFELLNLHKTVYPNTLFPRSVISFGPCKEPYEWLRDIIRFILNPTLIDQDTIETSEDLFRLLNVFSYNIKDDFLDYLLTAVNCHMEADGDYDNLYNVPSDILDMYLEDFPIRVTTASNPLFDTNPDLIYKVAPQFALLFSQELDIAYDLFDSIYVLDSSDSAYHQTSEFEHTLLLLTRPSTELICYDLMDSYPFTDNFLKPLYLDSLKEAYKGLL